MSERGSSPPPVSESAGTVRAAGTPDLSVCHLLGSLGSGGRETLIRDLIAHSDSATSHTICCFREDGEQAARFEERGVDVVSVDASSKRDLPAIGRLGRVLYRHEFDVLHAHGMNAQVPGRILARLCGIDGIVSTHHGVRGLYPERLCQFERVTRWLDTATVAVSEGVERSFVGDGNRSQWRTIRNGIDVDGFDAAVEAADGRASRRAHGVGPEETVFLNVGRYVPPKSQTGLVGALHRVVQQRPDVHLFIVGGRGPMAPQIRGRVSDRGLDDNVSVTGHVDGIHDYYAAADVFVSSSVGEGLPIVHLEAMAAKLPVVATDIPGVREVVVEGETGWLVPPNDPSALAEVMLAVAGKDVGKGHGRAGYERVREKFHVRDTAASYVSLYETIATEGGRR